MFRDRGAIPIDTMPSFDNTGSVESIKTTVDLDVPRYADMLSAMGTEPRLRIMRLLLAAHPEGMIPSDISSELAIPPSSLSHHLDKLKTETLINVRRDSKFLWYTANTEALRELIQFLYAECCTRNKAIKPEYVLKICKK